MPCLFVRPAPLQILFVAGIACIIGLEGTYNFFFKPQKLKGSLFFFAGIGVVLFGWAIIGFIIELYGIYLLFGYVLVCGCGCGCGWLGVVQLCVHAHTCLCMSEFVCAGLVSHSQTAILLPLVTKWQSGLRD